MIPSSGNIFNQNSGHSSVATPDKTFTGFSLSFIPMSNPQQFWGWKRDSHFWDHTWLYDNIMQMLAVRHSTVLLISMVISLNILNNKQIRQNSSLFPFHPPSTIQSTHHHLCQCSTCWAPSASATHSLQHMVCCVADARNCVLSYIHMFFNKFVNNTTEMHPLVELCGPGGEGWTYRLHMFFLWQEMHVWLAGWTGWWLYY